MLGDFLVQKKSCTVLLLWCVGVVMHVTEMLVQCTVHCSMVLVSLLKRERERKTIKQPNKWILFPIIENTTTYNPWAYSFSFATGVPKVKFCHTTESDKCKRTCVYLCFHTEVLALLLVFFYTLCALRMLYIDSVLLEDKQTLVALPYLQMISLYVWDE